MTEFQPLYNLPAKSWYRRWWGVIILLLISLLIIFSSAVFFQTLNLVQRLRRGENLTLILNQKTGQPTTITPTNLVSSDDPYLGRADAAITLVEFGDFSCPYSQASASILRQLFRLYPNNLKIVFKHFPILGDQSVLAAQAATCAQEQGNLLFWAFYDRLFADQNNFTADNFKAIAADLGLDQNQFAQCLTNNPHQQKIRADLQLGQKLNVENTPTFFLNGEIIKGSQPLTNWQSAIDYLLIKLTTISTLN